MRIALAQLNTVVGDLDGNRARVLDGIDQARDAGADLVLFPELAVTGYPPEDLLLRPGFIRAAERSLEEIARAATDVVALVGAPWFDRDLYNTCAVCAGGEVRARPQALPAELRGLRRAALLRARARPRDAPAGRRARRRHGVRGPVAARPAGHRPRARRSGAHRQRVGLPFHVGKAREREEMLVTRARDNTWLPRVLQHGRGAGRARLRRALGRARRRGRGARARASRRPSSYWTSSRPR